MMLVPACKGIGISTNSISRGGTWLWEQPHQNIPDMRWAEFVRTNFMWTFLLVQDRRKPGKGGPSEASEGPPFPGFLRSLRLAAPLNHGVPFNGNWESCVAVAADQQVRESMGWPVTLKEWDSKKSNKSAKSLRAKDIVPEGKKTGGAIMPNGNFQSNMLEALAKTEEDMPLPAEGQPKLSPEKWEGTVDRAQFLKRSSTDTNGVMLTFCKQVEWKGIAGETKLWREMNFVTSAELYEDGPPNREYLCLVSMRTREVIDI